jgi:Protein of unknown function (DUF3455)
MINDAKRAEKRALVCGLTVAAIVVGCMWLSSSPEASAIAGEVSVPVELKVPEGNVAFAKHHGTGSQQYVCLPNGTAFLWTLFAPQATLFDSREDNVITHFSSIGPRDAVTPHPAWQDTRDGSTAWGNPIASSRDYHYVAPDAIAWLLLKVVETRTGLNGVGRLEKTTYIQRINTVGGTPPVDSGCETMSDVGKKGFVPYRADYVFYRMRNGSENK